MKILWIALVGLVFVSGTRAVEASQGGDEMEWQLLSFPGIDPTRFVVDRGFQIKVVAENSSAILYRRVTADEEELRFLRWRWRVEMASVRTDLSRKGKDDRPLAIHLLFPAANTPVTVEGPSSKSVRPEVRDILTNGFVLTYVWGGARGRGVKVPNPHFKERGWQIILRDGEAQARRWFEEKVDFDHDFEKAFGFPPPMPGYIAISGDSDDSRSHSIGTIADLTFIDK